MIADSTLTQALERCAQEPIQLPGSIQPHGFLLVLDETDMRVLQASENVEHWLGIPASELIGREFAELVSGAFDLRLHLARLPQDEVFPFHISDVHLRQDAPYRGNLHLLVHRHDQVLIAEFEPPRLPADLVGQGDYYPLVRSFVGRLHQAGSLEELLQQAVLQLKRITGFGRVKAYRFDAEGNGQVLAEVADPGYPSYLGLCFPASDIPRQARELYRINRIRVIEDANYQASPLLPAANPRTGKPLDLSFAALRSVSPVHLQYMRNMGTLASMSLSIVVDGQLWGLVSCHHEQPRPVDLRTRTACELLASVLSLQIESRESHANTRQLLELRQHIVRMISSMADHDSVGDGLRDLPEVLLAFAGAQGAAVISAERCDLIGKTPPAAQVNALVHWLSQRGEDSVFHSDNLCRDIDELPELAAHAGGVLAVAISQIHSHYLLWFRPEQVRTVNWAGQPNKQVGPQGNLDPRHSFESWQEKLRGYCEPWHPLVIEGVQELRTAVLGIVLRKAEELAQLAGELRRSNKELEAFSYSVSHDLRAPLRHIAGYSELLGEIEGQSLSERGRRFLQHIEEAAHFAGSLVDNLLNFSQMGRSALRLSEVDLNALVEAIRSELAPDYESREIVWDIAQLPKVVGDPAFINMALHNLLANAIKYTRGRTPARIGISAVQHPGETEICIRDNGVGFDMAYANKLFGVFQRLHRMEDFEGTGIGLASVRRIIERHDGRVWAHGKVGQGATFHFTLPRHPATT
ncbi:MULTISPECIES: ATP-binding protein [Pseudomonas]|uniref:histidine kinase n=1 Tax=Pseudomonas shirazica TaxID=1940636 RepID=A0ABY9SVM3_9PSED|nr:MULTISPECIES: ATP-binding protein [Pseudomonas]CAB5623830.1 Phytochrome-like protein cph1 [Pseudomonas putida]MBO2923403.1 GAF domain-containing protein [Pseudomonas asiatica]MDH4430987.1 GAF domain-containing protein [Pseudomonas shirazica]PJI73846.1 ATPase [Pseudomonas sp. MR 02]QOE10797.1 GAF domain-containing protein [Pseudomonas asiatica]